MFTAILATITAFIGAHWLVLIIGYILFAAIVGGMPPVKDTAPYGLRWLYGTLHLLAINLHEAVRLLPLPDPIKRFFGCCPTKPEPPAQP